MGPPPQATPAAAIEIDAMFEYQTSTVASRAPIFLLPMVCAQDAADAVAALPGGSLRGKRRPHALPGGLKLKPDT
jgi:hypothetical protein